MELILPLARGPVTARYVCHEASNVQVLRFQGFAPDSSGRMTAGCINYMAPEFVTPFVRLSHGSIEIRSACPNVRLIMTVDGIAFEKKTLVIGESVKIDSTKVHFALHHSGGNFSINFVFRGGGLFVPDA